MVEDVAISSVPVPDKLLRDLARRVATVLPNFAERDSASGVKELHAIIAPILDTADIPDLDSGHRAAASNALCAVIEHCQASNVDYVQEAILEDSIWARIFDIYLHRSGEAKGKSMRQILLVITSVITKIQSPRALELRTRAATNLLDIICERQDRFKVKPALQGLAHFLLRDVISIAQLVEIYNDQAERYADQSSQDATPQTLFKVFLGWIVHHETALSAGHLIKNFLLQARHLSNYSLQSDNVIISPLWIVPVVQMLHDWPDRILEFKTHVFPHCFLPNIDEYLRFLSYLNFEKHVQPRGAMPDALHIFSNQENRLEELEEFRILLAAIASGKELTVVRDIDYSTCSTIEIRDGSMYLPDDISGTWMSHAEPEVRLAGMFLSVYSISVTKSISAGVLRALKRNLGHLHTETDPYFRREVLGNTQKLFDRLRASTATAARAKSKVVASSQSRLPFPKLGSSSQDPDLGPLAFVIWYLKFLEWELRPTASYQRRITALRSLTMVLRSGVDPGVPHASLSKSAQGQLNWAHGIQIASLELVRILLDLVLDAFDDVRDAAVSVLQLCLVGLPQDQKDIVVALIPGFLNRAETLMLRTGRADQADGVARAYGMIFSLNNNSFVGVNDLRFTSKLVLFKYLNVQLQETLELAHNNLSEAVDGRPVHGTFAALRYIVDQPGFYLILSNASNETSEAWRQIHKEVIASIESLWSCVYHVLCADAPEGHVPDEMEEDVSLDTKEILSYSWRGLKEASVLLRSIISAAPIGSSKSDFLTPQIYEKLGRLCFTQLLELRHRGAFSIVSQTFAAFCRRCVTSDNPALRALPETWYLETIRSIEDKADAITRRSAGIPALMSALLAAEPQSGSELFPRAMKDLIAETLVEAKRVNIEESRLPQVHALNCIKEIFTTSKLSVASEAYIGEGLELAAKTLNSEIWPLRNCSLMLFKALIERLLGSDEAQDWKERERARTSRFSYDSSPTLPKILSDLLDPNGPLKKSLGDAADSSSPFDLHGAEGVFPALQILRQARPPQSHLEPIRASVQSLLSSPHWHLRDMAARTDVSMRFTSELHDAAFSALITVPSSHNEQHGVLLMVKYMLTKLLRDPTHLSTGKFGTLMTDLSCHTSRWYTASDCTFVRAAFLDVVAVCGMTMLRREDTPSVLTAWLVLTESASFGPQCDLGINTRTGDALLQNALAPVFFMDRVIKRDTSSAMVSDHYQGIGEALMLLAIEDPDTCCAALETIDAIIQLKPSNKLTVPLSLILAHVHQVVLQATDPEVISKAQAVLADALQNEWLKTEFFKAVFEEQALSTLQALEAQCLKGPPSNMQSALHLLGSFLDFVYHSYPSQQTTVFKAIARYVRLLRMTIIDTNPFDTRFAAVQSLGAFRYIWTASSKSRITGPLLLALSFALYDMLNDDDDEIRDAAARTTGTLLCAQGQPDLADTVPILTSHRLATYLTTTFPTSPALIKEALRRVTNTPAPTPLFSVPFTQAFHEARQEDNALFAREKQNLYLDTTLAAIYWSHILSSLSVSRSVSAHLAGWVVSALHTLTHTAHTERDGPLGWATKDDVFTLVMRVLYAAEVVLRWRTVERSEVLAALGRFAEAAGGGSDVHGAVRERVTQTVERAVLGGLGRVGGEFADAGWGWDGGIH